MGPDMDDNLDDEDNPFGKICHIQYSLLHKGTHLRRSLSSKLEHHRCTLLDIPIEFILNTTSSLHEQLP